MNRCNVKTRDILATTSLLKDMRKLPGIQARSWQENTHLKNGGTLRSSYISMDIEYFTCNNYIVYNNQQETHMFPKILQYSHIPIIFLLDTVKVYRLVQKGAI